MTRLLLAGTGLIGHRHLAHILDHPQLDLAGIIEPDPDRRALSDAPGFADVSQVDVEADGIVIATPTGTHAPLTIAALNRGWHVLVEKPVAETLAEADAMIAAEKATGKRVLVGHHRRHHPRVAMLKDLISSGRIGRPLVASLLWCMKKPDDYFDPEWRQGMAGAPVKQNLIHDIDMLRWLFGEVTSVTGLGSNAQRGAARTESGGAVLGFDSGVILTVAFADTTPTPWGFEAGTGESPGIPKTGQDSLWIAGSEGAIQFPSLTVWTGAKSWGEAPKAETIQAPETVPLVRQLEHFADVITGAAEPRVSAWDGRQALAAILEIEAATLPAGVS